MYYFAIFSGHRVAYKNVLIYRSKITHISRTPKIRLRLLKFS